VKSLSIVKSTGQNCYRSSEVFKQANSRRRSIGCNGDPNCPECLLKNKIKPTLTWVHVLTHICDTPCAHPHDSPCAHIHGRPCDSPPRDKSCVEQREKQTCVENIQGIHEPSRDILLQYLERASVLFYQGSLTLVFCQDIVITACSAPSITQFDKLWWVLKISLRSKSVRILFILAQKREVLSIMNGCRCSTKLAIAEFKISWVLLSNTKNFFEQGNFQVLSTVKNVWNSVQGLMNSIFSMHFEVVHSCF